MPSTELSRGDRLALRWPSPAALATDLSRGGWLLAPHLDFISRILRDRIVQGDARLCLTCPPRHGKSELCSVWLVAWFLAMRPWARVGVVTYGHQFSAKWGRRIRSIIREHGATLGLTINPEKDAANEFELLQGGSVLCTGVGGVMTGHGFDLLIVDDPHKNREEAESDLIREKTIEWWQSTARSRLEPGASVFNLMQRWREDDLVGFFMSDESGEAWELINLPAVAEEDDPLGREVGEALWPTRYDTSALEKWMLGMNSYNWASQFQQRPSPAGGSIFRREHFRTFTEEEGHVVLQRGGMDPKRFLLADLRVYQTADTALKAKTTSDWTVCLTFGMTPDNDLLVLDVARARLEVPDQLGFLFAQRARHAPVWQGVEDKASGTGLIQTAQRRGKPFRMLKADVDKVLRATQASVMYENGMVYHRAGAPWLNDFEHELLSFPNGAHDDQVDCIAYAAREAETPPPSAFWV